MDEFGKVGAEMSYLQSQMHSDYDTAESIADSDLEDGEQKCWLHHCICKVEKTVNPVECQSNERNLLLCNRREEQVQSVLKLDLRESLMSIFSFEPSAPEKTCCIVFFWK